MDQTKASLIAPILESLQRLTEGDLSARVSLEANSPYLPIAKAINGLADQIYHSRQQEFSGSYAMQALAIGVWTFDVKSSQPQWDPTMRRLFGVALDSKEDLLVVWQKALSPAERVEVWANFQKALQEGGEFDATYEIQHPESDERRLVYVRASVIRDETGQAISVHGIAYDRTTEFMQQRELASMKRDLEDALASARKSEKRYRNLFDNFPIGVSLIDTQGNYLATNSSYSEMIGYSESELKRIGVPGILDPEERPFLKEVLAQTARSAGNSPAREIRMIHKSGRQILAKISARTSTDDQGNTLITSLVQDISLAHRQSIENAQLRHEKDEIFRAARFSIVTTDLKGVITGFSAEAERLSGHKAADLIGSASPPFLHDPDEIMAVSIELSKEYGVLVEPGFETFVCKPRRGLFDERIWHVKNGRGERLPILLTVTGLRNADGALFGFMAVGKNISEEVNARKEAEAERIKSVHNLKLAALGEMAGGIAHEVNNPLAIIQMASGQLAELVEREPLELDRIKKHAAIVERTTERIAGIVRGLRNFSREGGTDPLVDVTVLSVVNETVSFCSERLRHRGVDLKIEPIPEALTVRGRQVQISQVLLNLLNNASDAISEQGEKWIAISTRQTPAHVEIRVTDSGTGVPEELRKRIFDPFFTTKDVGKGTGMGLSISIGIMRGQDGDLALDPESPHTCFVMRFPLLP